jgi:pseudouridine-5'-monophosphatase
VKLARRPSAVIFDLDGVLLDTEPLYTQATAEIVGEYGAVFDWAIKGDMIGRSALDGAEYLVNALGIRDRLAPEEYLRRRAPRLDALFPSAREIPGARAFVSRLAQLGIPLAVATSSERYQYELKITHHDWFGAFRAVVCGDDPRIGALKPAPDIFLVTACELGVTPEQCLVFEDSLAGVASALAAGMQVVALPDPAMDSSRYASAHLVVRSYAEIVLDELGLEAPGAPRSA